MFKKFNLHGNMCYDRSMQVYIPAIIIENYDRQTNQPTYQVIGKCFTSNNAEKADFYKSFLIFLRNMGSLVLFMKRAYTIDNCLAKHFSSPHVFPL